MSSTSTKRFAIILIFLVATQELCSAKYHPRYIKIDEKGAVSDVIPQDLHKHAISKRAARERRK